MPPSPNDAILLCHLAPNDAKLPNDANKPAHQCYITSPRRRQQARPPMPCHHLLMMMTTLPKHATSPPRHQPPTMPPSNPTSPVPDDLNDATSPSRMTCRMVGWWDQSSCEEGRTSREDGQGDDEAACIPHAILFCLFFSSMGQCAPCTLPYFFLLEAALLLGDQQGSMHPTCCLVWFAFPPPQNLMYDKVAWIPHAASSLLIFPPFESARWRASHTPSQFVFFFFFSLRGSPPAMTATTRRRESYTPPCFPFLFQHRGSVDLTCCLVLLHSFINEAVCTLHTATFCFLIIFVVTCNFF